MTFTLQNKPDPGDFLTVSQGDLKQNVQYFQATLNKDHQVVFGDTNASTFEGRHRQVALKGQTLPYATVNDGEMGTVYAGSDRNLYWQEGATNPNPSLTRIMTPKAFVLGNSLGTISGDSFNVATIAYVALTASSGRFTINFTNSIRSTSGALSTNYIVFNEIFYPAGGTTLSSIGAPTTKGSGSIQIDFFFAGATGPFEINLLIFGG